jgi:hypothetical protein
LFLEDFFGERGALIGKSGEVLRGTQGSASPRLGVSAFFLSPERKDKRRDAEAQRTQRFAGGAL